MVKRTKESVFLLEKYFHLGWLNRRYLLDGKYIQPYSAEDRLFIGKRLYEDFLAWRIGTRLTRDYQVLFVDVSPSAERNVKDNFASERFRRALRCVSKITLPVLYQVVLEEREIKPPLGLSERERLYFNDEVKGLLCRGLDEILSGRASGADAVVKNEGERNRFGD